MVNDGKIGDVHIIKITSRDPAPPPAEYSAVSGGMFLDMTIHDFDMARTHVQEVGTEQVLVVPVAYLDLGNRDEVLVLANIVGKALVTQRVDFARNDKTVGPDFY